VDGETRSGLDRSIVAGQVLGFLSQTGRRLVILYGRRGSRKSDLIKQWVMPRLDSTIKTEFAECDPNLAGFKTGAGSPDRIQSALGEGKMVFLAHADHCLFMTDERYPSVLLNWIQAVEQNQLPGSLVLSVPERSLSNVLTLQNLAPSLLSNILEIEPISFRDSLLHLTSISQESDLTYDAAAVNLLDAQAQKLLPVDPIELAQGIDQGFRYFKPETYRCVTVDDCEDIGGIPGVLDELRKLTFENARERFGPASENIVEVILVESAYCSKAGRAFDITDLALRLGLEPSQVDEILTWLCETERILRRDRAGGIELVPIELSAVVEQNAQVSHKDISRGAGILHDGVRSWAQLGSVLPQKRLDEVNSIREWLITSDEETVLVVRSLLRVAGDEDCRNLIYWLHRIRSRDAQISVLLENLFAVSPAVRRRVAVLLATYDDREVLKQLHRVATEDPDADVRAAALASLANMNTDELWPLVSQEARQPTSPYQIHAVSCLRLFKDDRSWQLLKELVSSNECSAEVRQEAIETLAQLRTPASIQALVEISLYHEDRDVRVSAGAALATIQSAELARHAVDAVRDSGASQGPDSSRPAQSVFAAAWQIAAGLAIATGNIVVHGVALMTLRRLRPGLIFLGIEAALFLVRVKFGEEASTMTSVGLFVNWLVCQLMATRASYSWLKAPGQDTALSWSRNPRPKSRLTLSLFCWLLVLDVIWIFLFHGLVHALAGRFKRSLKLLFFECVGGGCCFAARYCFTSDIVWITPLPTNISRVMFPAYLAVGIVIFLYTLVADIVPMVIEVFQNQSGGAGWRAKIDLLRVLASNPFVAEYLLQSAQTGNDADQHWAKKIVRRTAHLMPYEKVIGALASHENPTYLIRGLAPVTDKELLTAVTEEMKQATPRVQKRIVNLLTCRPSEASLAALRSLRKTAGWYGRVMYSAGVWYHRLLVWPSGILLVIILTAPFPILAAVEIIQTSADPDRPVMRMVENSGGRSKLTDDQLLEALQFLAKFDRSVNPDQLQKLFISSTSEPRSIWTEDPSRLAIEVCSLPLDTGDSDQNQKLNVWRQQLFFLVARSIRSNAKEGTKALTTIRERDDLCGMNDVAKEKFVEAASLLLKDNQFEQQIGLAIIILDTASTESAVDQLKALLASLDRTANQRATAPEQARRDELRRDVIAALARNDADSASSALENIAKSKSTSPKIAELAKARLQDRIDRQEAAIRESVQTPLGNGDYEAAYNQAARILDSHPIASVRDDVLDLQATAAYKMALSPDASESWTTKAVAALERMKNTPKWDMGQSQKLSVAYQLRAETNIKQDQYDRAISDARLAIKADPTAAFSYELVAWILQQQGKTEESRPFVRDAIDKDPTVGASYDLLYAVHISRIDNASSKDAQQAAIETAVADFRKLAEDHPDIVWPRESLAEMLHDRAFDFEQSYRILADLQKSSSSLSDADKLTLESNFMEAQFTAGRYKDAEASAERLEGQLSTTDYGLLIPVTLYAYMTAVELGNLDSAKTAWNRLLELVSHAPRAYKLVWRYDGTIRYLEQQRSSSVQQALLDLVVSMNELDNKRQLSPKAIAESKAILHIDH
jgi:tetratricopeptide (TPR) repeat protein